MADTDLAAEALISRLRDDYVDALAVVEADRIELGGFDVAIHAHAVNRQKLRDAAVALATAIAELSAPVETGPNGERITTLAGERGYWRTNPSCLEHWPDHDGSEYHPSCCRFPKSCSSQQWVPIERSER